MSTNAVETPADISGAGDSDELARLRRCVADIARWTHLHTWVYRVDEDAFRTDESLFSALGQTSGAPRTESFRTRVELIHPDDRDEMRLRFRRLLEDPASDFYHCEYRMRHADGRWRWMLDTGDISLRDATGRPLEVAGVVQDITKARDAADAVTARQARLEMITTVARIGTWDFNKTTGEIRGNAVYAEILGYPPERFGDRDVNLRNLCHPEDRPRLLQAIRRHRLGEAPLIDCEFRILSGSGRERWVLLRGQIVERNDNGDMIRTLGTVQDITPFKRTEEAIRRQNRLLLAMGEAAALLLDDVACGFDAMMDRVLDLLGSATGADRVCVWRNHSGSDGRLHSTQIYEWSLGAPPQQGTAITVDIDLDANVPGWRETLSDNRCVGGLVRKMSAPERTQLEPRGSVSILVAPIRFGNQLWGFIGFDDCHSERAWSALEETALKSAALMLGNAVRRRDTQADIERALEQARENARLAEEASRAKVDFLVGVSSDLQTPILSIADTTDGLLASDLSDFQRAHVEEVRERVNAMALLLGDLLDYSLIEAGRLTIGAMPFDFAPLVEDVCEEPALACQRRGAEFSLQWEATRLPLQVVGEAARLRQVLSYMIGHAVGRVEAGGEVVLQTVLCDFPDGQPGARFAVLDTGPEIPSEEYKTLFHPKSPSAMGARGVTGLELPLAKAIIDLAGGVLGVESAPEGTTFWFQLPMVAVPDAGPPLPVMSGRALALDADINARIALRMSLTARGLELDEAETAAEALTLAAQVHYDWIFVGPAVDEPRPDVTGRRLARLPEAARTRRVLTLPSSRSDQAAGYTRQGFSSVLFKPLRQAQLRECLSLETEVPFPTVEERAAPGNEG